MPRKPRGTRITAYVTEETADAIQRMADGRGVPVSQVASELSRLGAAPEPEQAPLALTPAPELLLLAGGGHRSLPSARSLSSLSRKDYGRQVPQFLTCLIPVLAAARMACSPVLKGPCSRMSISLFSWDWAVLQLYRCTIAMFLDARSLTTYCIVAPPTAIVGRREHPGQNREHNHVIVPFSGPFLAPSACAVNAVMAHGRMGPQG